MSLTPGTLLGPYEIIAPLGAGGMGEVYRARDTRLARDVAIKVLPPAFAEDAARMQRFEREAQVLASLNHPNIAAIYGIERGAIVMELVEGADLCGPVPMETALVYARQIAVALEAAHEKGIVHRDLKPANIKVTPDGVIKLLDFGLAKATEQSAVAGSGSPTMSPTLSLAMTQAGMILGTAGYMSPEQARGKPVDHRADIWAFGVILFELLTGMMLFGGETVSDSLAAVLTREPDFNVLPADTPPRLRRLVELCLRKDQKQRLQAIGDARILLDEAEPVPPAAAASRRVWMPWAIAGVLGLALLAVGSAWLRPRPVDPGTGVSRFLIPLPSGTGWPISGNAAAQWVPSPDGRNVAIAVSDANTGKNWLWVRPLGGIAAHRLDQTEGAVFPFWSPDGQSIGFFAESKLRRVAASGGGVQTICDLSTGGGAARASGDGATWNQEGVIVYANFQGPLMRVPAMGGMPVALTALEKGERSHTWPQFLPDGKHVLYLTRTNEAADHAIYVQELGSTKRIRVLQNATRAMWSAPGYLLFVRDGALFAQRVDAKTFQVSGEALAVAQEVVANDGNGRSSFAISQNGVLAYRSGANTRISQLTWHDRDGKVVGLAGKPGEFNEPVLSPDGKSVALTVRTGPDIDVWVMDLSTSVLTRMSRDGVAQTGSHSWAPDSQRLAVAGRRGGIQEISLTSGQAVPLTKEVFLDPQWLPDGRSLVGSDGPGRKIFVLSTAEGGKLQTILETPYRKGQFRLSPDGRYVAYLSDDSGLPEVYVASFPSFAAKRKVSAGFAQYPTWTKGGREILYRAVDGVLTSVDIRTGSTIEAGSPKALFKYGTGTRGNVFAVTPDGMRILTNDIAQEESEQLGFMLVLNWAAELKQP